mgnify:FL=1
MDQQKIFMHEAIRLSIGNVQSSNGGPFGAVIVKNGEIIATGVNEVTKSNDPTAHAEIIAIRNACKTLDSFQLDDCEIYCSCELCPMCLGAIYWVRPKAIYFANTKTDATEINFDDNYIYQELELPIHERKLLTIQLLRDEAQSAFLQWQKSDKTIDY